LKSQFKDAENVSVSITLKKIGRGSEVKNKGRDADKSIKSYLSEYDASIKGFEKQTTGI
jgi:hypothetical protein